MAPLIAALTKWGLTTLAGAVVSKGKEVVQEKLGVNLDDALGTEQGRIQLKQLEMQHEQFLVNAAIERDKLDEEADAKGQQQVTDRWKADMASDSWLSKNVRPSILVYLTVCITLMALISGMASGFKVAPEWVDLLKAITVIVYSAYFIGRTSEKAMSIWRKK